MACSSDSLGKDIMLLEASQNAFCPVESLLAFLGCEVGGSVAMCVCFDCCRHSAAEFQVVGVQVSILGLPQRLRVFTTWLSQSKTFNKVAPILSHFICKLTGLRPCVCECAFLLPCLYAWIQVRLAS